MEKLVNDIIINMKLPATPERKELILRAYEFAKKAHTGQKRRSGEDYITHTVETAIILAKLGMDSMTISAGLLHDVPEDTATTLEEVEKKFGKEIAFLVDGVTKIGRIKLRGEQEELQLENMRKMFLAMASDIRVIIIKLADRLHNMRTLEFNPPDKQIRIARETMEVFVPIANRLGIGEIKGSLEDLAFKYLDPENFEYVKNLEEEQYTQRKRHLDTAVVELKKELLIEGIKTIDIFGRAKHLYRLFQKLKRHDMDINKIYDLVGIRIIVPDISACYEALGIVHRKYRPLVGRIKDYISLPKPNGYQSIHTTVFGHEGKILEVQIRTKQMDDEAEFGIAAHWIYSEQQKRSLRNFIFGKKVQVPQKELLWVKQLREWQNDLGTDNAEFMEGLKIEFFKNHIFAFTPMGNIIELPEDATPIDFAYKVHSEIGNRAVGVKIDGKMAPIDCKIKNGQVIEILTSKEHKKPSQDWLRFVRTSLAKSQIKKALRS
ncbi:MAG: RelA/SpoT family protein [Parcubacteria group bacterium]